MTHADLRGDRIDIESGDDLLRRHDSAKYVIMCEDKLYDGIKEQCIYGRWVIYLTLVRDYISASRDSICL